MPPATTVGGPALLSLWERAAPLPPLERSLALAEAAGAARAELLQQPLGATHRGVLTLRQGVLGGPLAATAACPWCQERVEFALAVPDVLAGDVPAPVAGWRAPTPVDLMAAAQADDPVAALRTRCQDSVGPGPADELLADADPLAELLLDLHCPACGTGFAVDLDIGSYVWQELDAAARRLLLEVATLARAYGWTEPQVLALTPARRAAYLRIAGGGAP
jgi:hypothetical protein